MTEMNSNNRLSFCLKTSVSNAELEINRQIDELIEDIEKYRKTLLKNLMEKENELSYNCSAQDLETLRRHKLQTEEIFRENRQQELLAENMEIIDKKIKNIRDILEIKVSWNLEDFQKALANLATLSSCEEEAPPPPPVPRRREQQDLPTLPEIPPHSSIVTPPHRVVRITEDGVEEDYMAMQPIKSQSVSSSEKQPKLNRGVSNEERGQVSGQVSRGRWNTICTPTLSRKPHDPLPLPDNKAPAIPPKNQSGRRPSQIPAKSSEKILGVKIDRINPLFAGCNKGKEASDLNKPGRVDIDIASTDIYITDTYNHCVKVFDRSGTFKFQFGRKSPGKITYPFGLCLSSKMVYVGEKLDGRIKMFNLDGSFIKEVTGDGATKKGNYRFIWGISADSDNGDIYACDNEGDRIQVYNSYLEFKYTVIGEGKPGTVFRPVDVRIRDFMIIVLDQNNPCLHHFDKQGVPLWSTIAFGEVAMSPQSFTMDMEDNVLITDALSHTIRIFTPKGELYIALGKKGENKGEFTSPTGIALDTNGNILSLCQRDKANFQIISYQVNFIS